MTERSLRLRDVGAAQIWASAHNETDLLDIFKSLDSALLAAKLANPEMSTQELFIHGVVANFLFAAASKQGPSHLRRMSLDYDALFGKAEFLPDL